MAIRARALAAVLLVASAGAQAQGLFDDNVARRRIADLRLEFEAERKAVDEKLARIEAAVQDRRAIIDLAALIDGLKQDIARLHGQSEVFVNRSETLERRQRELYVDLDNRLRKIEQFQAQLEQTQAHLQQIQTQIQDRLAQPEREAAAEKQAYEAALNQFKAGNYQASIAAFQTFMAYYPNSSLVPSAQYWIGNAYYALREYQLAIAAQRKLINAWPENAKAPDALLNIASSQQELGDLKGARETLKMLVTRYPQSPASEQAKQRLGGRR